MQNFVEVVSKKGKRGAKKAESDELDRALDMIDNENVITLRKIKEHMASQLSDTDGGDANLLSTPELLVKCKLLITEDNPTGQPPGSVQTGPTMLNLLTRYQTYATIVKGTAVREPVQQQVSKPRSGFASFPPGRDAASAHKAAAAKVKAVAASPKVTKSAVKTTTGVKPLVMIKKSTKQYAVSTVQGQMDGQSHRSRYCPVDRLGSYTSGQRKFATSALGTDGLVSVQADEALIDVIDSSEENEVEVVDAPWKKQRVTEKGVSTQQRLTKDDVPWDNFPLLPVENVGEEDESFDDIHSDISDNTADQFVDHNKIHTFLDAELVQLEQGSDAHLFFACVEALPQGVYLETPSPVHTEGVFQQIFTCPAECLLTTLTDHDDILTVHEQQLCESAVIRSQYHFLCQKTFWHNTIDDCRKHLSGLKRDHHLDVVMIGEGFTNSVWSHTSTLQYDVQKLWYFVQKYGKERYDSIVPDFGQIPIKYVTLDLLLMLPIKAVFGYLQYHGVDVTRTPWRLISTIDKVEQLPVGTQIPFGIWCNYLVVMLDYLHGLMRVKHTLSCITSIQ
jgi:hypothetical protein